MHTPEFRRFATAALLLAAGAATAAAQCGTNWAQVQAIGPGARVEHAMAYDSARGRVVFFGGWGAASYRNDTWEWDGALWIQRTPVLQPPVRAQHAMAYDSARGRVVLFGGTVSSTGMSDTWEWDGGAGVWTPRSPATSPPGRHSAAMVFDAARGRTVLFGGQGPSFFGDTWEWDGSNWTLAATSGPSARAGHAMAYDSVRARTVLFGGSGLNGPALGTWEYNGTSWIDRAPSISPPPTNSHAMVFDAALGRVVLFGGSGNNAGLTWEFDPAGAWIQRSSTGPSPRQQHAMAYDTVRQRAVLFGGRAFSLDLADTWEWQGLPSGGPAIQQPPVPVTRDPGQSAQFTVAATGSGTLTYRWYRRNLALSNGGTISGADTDTLTLSSVGLGDTDTYSVLITDTCGSTMSLPALLRINCYPNCDGSTTIPILNVMDWICFQTKYASDSALPTAQQITSYANCDASTIPPVLNVNDFICFTGRMAVGCQ